MLMDQIERKTLGVIGGMGPIPTSDLLRMIIQMTDAACDQEHLDMILYNHPSIPDRTAYILDPTREDPRPVLTAIGKALQQQGVGCIAMPCVTAHYFYSSVQEALEVPVIHAIRETVAHLKAHGVTRAGIMATDGTLASGLLSRELEAQGLEALSPDPDFQADVMHLIYKNIKAGVEPEMDRFHRVNDHLRSGGAQAVILGCTELSVFKPQGPGFIDVLEVLAQRCVVLCGGRLKPEYQCLISK